MEQAESAIEELTKLEKNTKNGIEKIRNYTGKLFSRPPKIPKEVIDDRERIAPHKYRIAWIHNRTAEFWERPFKDVYQKLKKRIIEDDSEIYNEASIHDLRILTDSIKGTTREVYMPIIPRVNLPRDKIRLRYGQMIAHYHELYPTGDYKNHNPNPISLELTDAGVDPLFDVEIDENNYDNLKKEFSIEINTVTLNKMISENEEQKSDLERRKYRIKSGEMITLHYNIDSIPGRAKEIYEVPLD